MEQAEKNDSAILLRLPGELKAALLQQAAVNGRRITAEINIRLRDSLKPQAPAAGALQYPVGTSPRPSLVEEKTRDLRNSELEEAILSVIRGMPPEKQLAFLTLFK